MKKISYGAIVIIGIIMLLLVGCGHLAFNNPFAESSAMIGPVEITSDEGDETSDVPVDIIPRSITYLNTKNAANPNKTSFKESESVTIEPVARIGYAFNGWYEVINDITSDTRIDGWNAGDRTRDVILWAKWTANEVTYTVKRYFQNVSGSGYDASADIVKSGLTDAITDVTADEVTGFTPCTIVQQKISADGSTVVSVYYDRDVVVYTFNANGGSWNDDSNVKKAVGLYCAEVGTPANPIRTGYSFNAWDAEVPTVFGETAETWTAQWTANSYTIIFNANGGTGTMDNHSMIYDVSADLPANAFSRTNYAFKGWASSSDGDVVYTNKQNFKNLSETNGAEVTLYAIWRQSVVGDIMYSDMTFSSEYVDGKTPIGIVFEVGTKVKIVHLSEETSKEWCLDSADGCKCAPLTSTSDGSSNWQIICDAVSDEDVAENYPAFEYVNGLGSGWYLPAKDELNAVYVNKTVINAALGVLSGAGVSVTTLETKYWSSSVESIGRAFFQNFGNGYQGGSYCGYSGKVRAIRAF